MVDDEGNLAWKPVHYLRSFKNRRFREFHSWRKTVRDLESRSGEFDMGDVVVPTRAFASNLTLARLVATLTDHTCFEVERCEWRNKVAPVEMPIPASRVWREENDQPMDIGEDARDDDSDIQVLASKFKISPRFFWIARVVRVAGFRVKLRWLSTRSDDADWDCWVSIGSTDLHHVGYSSSLPNGLSELLVPRVVKAKLDQRYPGPWRPIMESIIEDMRLNCQTVNTQISDWRKELSACKFKVGDCVELLDRLTSTRVRPARVRDTCGTRIRVQVMTNEALWYENDEDAQVKDNYWLEQDSPLLFHVGWAKLNGYNLFANDNYMIHSAHVAQALLQGGKPPFAPGDTTPETIALNRPVLETSGESEWQVGMKLECMDILEENPFLKVATVAKVFKDGYLLIEFDDNRKQLEGDVEEFVLPLHRTSPLLCPIGYANQYGMTLGVPDEEEEDDEKTKRRKRKAFKWENYLKSCGAVAALQEFFHRTDEAKVRKDFKRGAWLEATDLCEPRLVCVARVKHVRGRFVSIHYEGWDYCDNYFEHTSKDLFPLGWCEMHNYPLEPPRNMKPEIVAKDLAEESGDED